MRVHGFRYYDPEIGRYLTRDPIGYGDGLNVYLYVGNNPINGIDPQGLFAQYAIGGVVVAAVIIVLTCPDVAPAPAPNDTTYYESHGGVDAAIATGGMVLGGVIVKKATSLGKAALGKVGEVASRFLPKRGVPAPTRAPAAVPGGSPVPKPAATPEPPVKSGAPTPEAPPSVQSGSGAARPSTTPEGTVVAETATSTAGNAGRAGKQARLRELADDPNLSSADRGWIEQEMNSIKRGQRDTIRNPPGKDLAHERGREAAKGYSYEQSNLQDRDLHKLQHKFDDFGRANKERPLRAGEE